MLVEQVGRDDLDPVEQMADALIRVMRRPPDHADDPVSLVQQQLGQVRSVLPGNPGDQCGRHVAP
jgi:hypothetical protein